MDRTLGELTTAEFEELLQRTIDRRMQVWLTQLMDAVTDAEAEDDADLRPEFAESLREAIRQAEAEEGIDLDTFARCTGVEESDAK